MCGRETDEQFRARFAFGRSGGREVRNRRYGPDLLLTNEARHAAPHHDHLH